ncbi:hypothetical protein FDECE_12859 [Fusarium decemcellulare]|nr:hypothetical protein FDECE_12859 [Fusarium decemcellulare]
MLLKSKTCLLALAFVSPSICSTGSPYLPPVLSLPERPDSTGGSALAGEVSRTNTSGQFVTAGKPLPSVPDAEYPKTLLETTKPSETTLDSLPHQASTATSDSAGLPTGPLETNTDPLESQDPGTPTAPEVLISQDISTETLGPSGETTDPIPTGQTETEPVVDVSTGNGNSGMSSGATGVDQTETPVSEDPMTSVNSGLPPDSTEQAPSIGTSDASTEDQQEPTTLTDAQTRPTTVEHTDILSTLSLPLTISLPGDSTGATGASSGSEAVSNTSDQSQTTTPSSDGTTATPSHTRLETDTTETSTNQDDTTQLPGEQTEAETSALTSDGPSTETDNLSSLIETSTEPDDATRPSSQQTQPGASETQATSATETDEPESTAEPVKTSLIGESTEPADVTTEPVDPKSTATNDEPHVTSPQDTKTEGQQATVTGTDGVVATWSATRDPEHSDVSQTVTQTDDDGIIIVIFPGGWKWSPVGGGKKGGPTPTSNPDPKDSDDEDDPDDDDDDDEEECTTTTPPECTMTLSYFTQDGGEETSTRIGSCAPVTGCVSGEQSTTTTTIAPEIPRITGLLPDDQPAQEPSKAEPVDDETVDYFNDLFKKWGIANDSTDKDPEAACEGVSFGANAECLGLFSKAFCDVVEEDETQKVSRNFTYEDVVSGDDIKAIVTGALRRSLHLREVKCPSHTFNFDWTGADGECNLSCSEAFEMLQTQCNNPFFIGLASEGTLDVGCGNYSYQVDREPTRTSSTTELPSTTPTITSTSASTSASTSTSTEEPVPTETEASFEIQNLQCNNEDDFEGHADISSNGVWDAVEQACADIKSDDMHMSPVYRPLVEEYEDIDSHKHRVTWSWIEGCYMEEDYVLLNDPFDEGPVNGLGDSRCVIILRDAWEKFSRRFRDTAQEILHHSFDPDCERCLTPNPWEHRLEPFLRTVAARPDLARSVKAAFLRVPLVEALSFDESRQVFDVCAHSLDTTAYEIYHKEHVHHVSDSAAAERAFLLREPAPEQMEQGDFIPVVASELLAMLVSLLPSLVHLGIEEDDSIRRRWQFDVSTATLKALGITTLSLKTFESDRALEKLLSHARNLETLATLGNGKLPSMPSLKHLHLRTKATIYEWTIERCLSACTGCLSTFSYTAVDWDIAKVVKCLDDERFHASLELLHLDLRCKPSARDVKLIPSLKLFTKLKTLFIPIISVYGKGSASSSLINILPPNITTLTLLEGSLPTPPHCLQDDLQSLARAKPALFTQLREIKSNCNCICDESLVHVFNEINVALIFQELPKSDWSCTGQASDDLHNCTVQHRSTDQLSASMLAPVEYTVGWVCALVSENVAAAEFLDEEHSPPQRRAENDTNTYTLGRIGQHNVVIAVLPLGEYGTASAAGVAINMLRSYPSIKIGLMVGIGGGVPSLPDRDIRLGDIVVSCPENGHSGVFQYDFGKTIQEKKFQHTRSLDQPPQALLTALAGLQMRHTRKGNGISKAVDQILNGNPKLKRQFGRPSSDTDILFESKFTHAGGSCASTCASDSANIVQRPERPLEDDDDPEIHYGTIASGNQLMKDAVIRDSIGEKENVLCFEMEAAGLMNRFPCVAIRGICDYSDSHKSKEWQGFAAMVAAAYARDLIDSMAPVLVQSENPILSKVDEALGIVQKIASGQSADKRREILNWLMDTDFALRQRDLLANRQPGTCQWLLDTEKYQIWTTTSNQTLFCYGIPGAGKTFLSSIVIHDLETKFNDDPTIGIAYIYCDYNHQDRQDMKMLLASVLKQLCQRLPEIPDDMVSLYERHSNKQTKASTAEICEVLQSVSGIYSRIVLVIDALDEWHAMQSNRSSMIQQVSDLQAKIRFSLFVTSRPMPDIQRMFVQHPSIEFEASQDDIASYTQAYQQKLPNFVNEIENPGMLKDMKEALSRATKGMFLVAAIYLERLKEQISARELRETLKDLEDKGHNNTLSDILRYAYDQMIDRIRRQNKNHENLAWKVLSWVTFARSKLTTKQLQHALVLRDGDTEIDYKGMVDPSLMVSVCCGIIAVDPADGTIRPIHYTAQAFLRDPEQTWFSNAEGYLAKQCIAYLSLCRVLACEGFDLNEQNAMTDETPLHLAATHGHLPIVQLLIEHGAETDLRNNLGYTPIAEAAELDEYAVVRELLSAKGGEAEQISYAQQQNLLYHAIENPDHKLVRFLLDKRVEVDSRVQEGFQDGDTALIRAAHSGNKLMVQLLLEEGANPNLQGCRGVTALMGNYEWASSPEVTKLLLDGGANPNLQNEDGETALMSASWAGEWAIVGLLLDSGADPNIRGEQEVNTALIWAVTWDYEAAVELLIAKGANINLRGPSGATALIVASEEGYVGIVKLLLENGADPDVQDDSNCTALMRAIISGHKAVSEVLIGHEVAVHIQDRQGYTALMLAIKHADRATSELLIEKGHALDLKEKYGYTALDLAFAQRQRGVTDLLVQKGATANMYTSRIDFGRKKRAATEDLTR